MRCVTCDSPLPVDACCPRCALAHALALGAGPAVEADTGWPRPAIPGYEALYELGRGSMGVVWLARDIRLERLVALKVIGAGADPRFGPRLLREGRAIAQLRHPHIVSVHALGDAGGATFLAMDFLAGGDLQSQLGNRPMPHRDAAALAGKLATALAHAHAAGVLHRDLKPSNILLDENGEPHLADFGLAAPLTGAGDLTAPGQIAGTPGFLAPELLAGAERASTHSDVYGLGAVLYVCLTGRAPFVGESVAAVLTQVMEHEPPSPRALNPQLPRDLEVLCLKCLDKNPAARYPSAAALHEDLQRYLRGEPLRARPVGRAVKLVRWCRRKPALAAASAVSAALLLVLAVGGPLAAWHLARAREATDTARRAALAAGERTREQLRDALLARSRATRLTGVAGQRSDALAALAEAAQIRPGLDVRNEAIAALALPDFTERHHWTLRGNTADPVAFAPDPDRYVVEAPGRKLTLHRLADGAVLRTFSGLAAASRAGPHLSPDARYVVVRDAAARVLVWHESAEAPVFTLEDRRYLLGNSVPRYGEPDTFSPDGTLLASTAAAAVVLHATRDGRELRRIPVEEQATHVAYSPDGTRLAIGRGLLEIDGRSRGYLRILDAARDTEICRLPVTPGFQSLAWSRDSRTLLAGGQRLELFDVQTGKLVRTVIDPRANRGLFGPEGTLLSANQAGVVTLWDPGTARPLLSGNLGSQPEIAVDRAGRRIVKASGVLGRIYDLELSPVVTSVPSNSFLGYDNVTNHGGSVIDYSEDGKWIVTAAWGAVHLRDAATGHVVALLPLGTPNNHAGVCFARDNRSLLSASRELGLVRIPLTTATDGPARLEPPETLDPERDFVLAALSPGGERAVLVSMWRGEVKVVGLGTDAAPVRWKLSGPGRAVFLAGGREVLVNSFHDLGHTALAVHDAATGQSLRTLRETRGYHARTSADGRWLVLGTGANQSVLRHTSDWSPGPPLPEGLQGAGKNAAFSRDGTWLAVGQGSTVALIRTATGEVVAHLETRRSGTYLPDLAFSPDASQLAAYWENGLFTVWNLRALRRELAARGLDW